jgi:hypothetical protein
MRYEAEINDMMIDLCRKEEATLSLTVQSNQESSNFAAYDVAEAYFKVAAEAIRSARPEWKWVGTQDRLMVYNSNGPILTIEDERGWDIVVRFFMDEDHPDVVHYYDAVRNALPKEGHWWSYC